MKPGTRVEVSLPPPGNRINTDRKVPRFCYHSRVSTRVNIRCEINENKAVAFEIAGLLAQRWGRSVIEDELDYRCDKACHRMKGVQFNMLFSLVCFVMEEPAHDRGQ